MVQSPVRPLRELSAVDQCTISSPTRLAKERRPSSSESSGANPDASQAEPLTASASGTRGNNSNFPPTVLLTIWRPVAREISSARR